MGVFCVAWAPLAVAAILPGLLACIGPCMLSVHQMWVGARCKELTSK